MLALWLALMSAPTPTLPLRVRLGPEGEILTWLVAGPFPNEGALQLRGTGFRTDYLQPENTANPVEGGHWKLAYGNPKNGLDLNAEMGNGQPAIGYAFVNVLSLRPQDVGLWFGSDDGARVWVNGKVVYEKQIARGVKRDEERVPIHLLEGANRLLFKIEQGDGGWGLLARLVDAAGKPAKDLEVSISVARTDTGQELLPILRQQAGKADAVDAASIDQYLSTSSDARLWLKNLRAFAKDPDVLANALQQSTTAFSASISRGPVQVNQAVQAGYRLVSETWHSARKPWFDRIQHPEPLVNADPTKEDFASVMPGGHYFVHEKGQPFIPISVNHNPDWPELEQANPLAKDYDPDRTDRWFQKMADKGINLVRLMVETPPSGNLEETPGVFRPEHVQWLDTIFLAARHHGIKLMVTPYDTFWMNLRAETSPYWAANGGPIHEKIDFLTKPEIIELQKGRMKFLIDRYGNLGTVFAWEIMNEIDLWWGATPAQVKAWADEMTRFVRSYQVKRWGRSHLLTMSLAVPEPKGDWAEQAFRRPDLDFATAHLYVGRTRATKPGEEIGAGDDFADGVRHALSEIRDHRPFFDGESGPIDHWVEDEKLDDKLFHQMSWSHLMAGGAGPGTRWPYRNPHHVTFRMLDTLHAMRTFTDAVPWQKLAASSVPIEAKLSESWREKHLATGAALILWAEGPAEAGNRIQLTMPFAAIGVKWRVFDVQAHQWLSLAPPKNQRALSGVRTSRWGERSCHCWFHVASDMSFTPKFPG